MPFYEPLTGPLNGALLLSVAAAVIYALMVTWQPSWRRTVIKALAVALLAWLSFAAEGPLLLIAALAFAAIGDAFLANDGERNFLAGLIAFFIGHCFYVALFATHPSTMAISAAPLSLLAVMGALVLVAVLYGGFLWQRTGNLRVPVMAYIAVILAMVITGLLVPIPLVGLGVVMFMMSDMILAYEQFIIAEDSPHAGWIRYPIWVLYYSGQLLIVLGLLLTR